MGAAQQLLAGYAAASAGGGTTAFVTGQTLGTLRNDFTGKFGMRFTVGASPITVLSLGRWVVAGNSAAHTVSLCSSADNIAITVLGSVSIATSGATAAAYKYVALGSSVVLSAATDYWLLSDEVDTGDQWYSNDTTITTTAVATLYGAYYYDTALHLASTDKCYVPVSFKY